MYKIGDFSKITGASIRTLRYYDEIDLFKPDEVDLFTGYRYYSDEKIKEYEIITELKDVGFTLEEIKEHWNKFNDQVMIDKKNQLLQETVQIANKIKKIDQLRSHLKGGKIVIENDEFIEPKVKKLVKSNITSIKISEESFNTYIRFNGEKSSNTYGANALKNNTSRYYVIYINNEFLDDFQVFDEFNKNKNYLKIELDNNSVFDDEDIMNKVFKKISQNYSYITISILEELQEKIEKAYAYNFEYAYTSQEEYKYIILKKNLRKDDL